MKCQFCTKDITRAQEADRVEVWSSFSKVTGEQEKTYGNVPGADGALKEATGWFLRAYHRKCWLADKRRQGLRDAKDADPSAQDRQVRDWREPVTADVEDIRHREGDRSH